MFAQESVMDIKKLKAEFEKLKYIEEKLEYLNFDEHLDCYVEKSNGMPVGLAAWVNGAFYGFEQAATAQAAPEGFVLVPKDKISHFYQDNDEPENFCNSSNDWDCLGEGMDIQKEREAFEELIDIEIIISEGFKFNPNINQYYHPDHTNHRLSYAYLMGAWMVWQEKAQAVPEGFEIGRLQDRITELLDERQELYAQLDAGSTEGFVLRPKEPTQEMIQAGLEKVRESWDDAPPDGFNSFTWGDMVATWEAMIEVQEPSND